MKKLLMIGLLFIGFKSQAQQFSTPIEYNDYIINLQTIIGEKIIAFNEALNLETATFESLLPYHRALIETSADAVAKTKSLPAYEGNSELRDNALALFEFYYKTFSNEYLEMIKIIFETDLDDAEVARLSEILEYITANEATIDNNFQTAQKAFAEKYNMTLGENELQDKLGGE